MSSPLRPELYRRLLTRFGEVRITHPGEEMVERVQISRFSRGRRPVAGRRSVPVHYGEYYHVCCPFCGDTRYRLGINHRWGLLNPGTNDYRLWLAKCFNEDCLKRREFPQRLWRMVFTDTIEGNPDILQQGTVRCERIVSLPGPLEPVDRLPPDHLASMYLYSRGFNLEDLARQYSVGYCEQADPVYYLAQNRLVIPIYQAGTLTGWQARFIGDRHWPTCLVPKYYSMPGLEKAKFLYNFDQASQFPTVVVVEGVTDVWRVGPQAVALLGHDISPTQMELLTRTWHQGSVVLLLDGDAVHAAEQQAAVLRRHLPDRVVLVTLPGQLDPGVVQRVELWGLIHNAAALQGVTLALPAELPTARLQEAVVLVSPSTPSRVNGDPRLIMAHLLNENNPLELADVSIEVLAVRVEEEKLGFVLNEIELPLREPVQAMAQNGIGINKEFLEALDLEFQEQLLILQQEVYRIAGRPFNLNSSVELANFLFGELRLPLSQRTDSGQPSLTDDTLQGLGNQHPVALSVLGYRTFSRLASFVGQIHHTVNPGTLRIHCKLDPLGAKTGRFSCSDPPLHGVPSELLDIFVAAPENYLLEADFSQIELRVLAHLSQDQNLIQAFLRNADLHRRTASIVLSVAEEVVTSEQRNGIGKQVNFGIIYGQTDHGLADALGISVEQARGFLENFFVGYPGVQGWIHRVREEARQNKYVTTLFGRRRRFPLLGTTNRWEEEGMFRQAVNAVIQGTAADLNKLALIRLHRELDPDCRLLLTVHDSVLVEVPRPRIVEVALKVRDILEDHPPGFSVPLVVDVGWGETWGECKQKVNILER